MKVGLILHNYGESAIQASGFNIGDPIQSIVLEQLYFEMGIEQDNIIKINLCDLSSYNGEYVLLPMLSVAIGVGFCPIPLSPKIIPLFISAHFVVSELDDKQISYLKEYSPIGCRDEYSLKTMRRYGIPAYLSGCLTVLFNRRPDNIKGSDVFLIDTPEELECYIPKSIKEHAIRETHLIPIAHSAMTSYEAENLLRISKERLKIYYQRAKLVISSRMHALVPCMAMGIPVIAVFENLSYRFSWLDKYIKLYTSCDFAQIDWNPNAVNYENIKNQIKKMAIQQIQLALKKYSLIYDISEFYEKREYALYGNKYHDMIDRANLKNENFEYIIWGCGLIGNTVYEIMNTKYPKAKLKVAVDEFATGKWHNVNIIKSDELENYPNCFIILATYSGRVQGINVMNKLGKKEFQDYIYLGTING